MQRIRIQRLIILSFAGTLGGLLIFLLFNPSISAREASVNIISHNAKNSISEMFTNAMTLSACFAALVAGILLLADEITSPLKRVAIKTFQAATIGCLVGGLAGIIAQIIFIVFIMFLSIVGVILGRGVGWAVMGCGAGAGIGFALGSWRRAYITALGGMAGGFVAGLLFDAVAFITGGGSASRFIGFLIMGFATGAAVALIDDIAKKRWVTILTGSKEGKTFIITNPTTVIGRDELADIPLFGDVNVAKRHAALVLDDKLVSIKSEAQNQIFINNTPSQYSPLKNGDIIGVGRHKLMFHESAARALEPQLFVPKPIQQNAFQPAPLESTGRLILTAIAGPQMSQVFQLMSHCVQIGRDSSCTIPLLQDYKVSRSHAEIIWDGQNWVIRDLDSTNGVWLNGLKISRQVIKIGDQIGLGQTLLRVDTT